jgi:hypothetical protein
MSELDKFSLQDLHYYYYLNQKVGQAININMLKSNIPNLSLKNIKNSTELTPSDNTSSSNKTLAQILEYYFKGLKTEIFKTTVFQVNLSTLSSVSNSGSLLKPVQIGIDKSTFGKSYIDRNFRVIILQDNFMLTNLSYDESYLTTPPGSNLIVRTSKTKMWQVAPKIYLELCTGPMNNFFKNIFPKGNDKYGYTMVGDTIESINRFCMGSSNIGEACSNDRANPRCACQDCFIGHSQESRQITETMRDAGVISDDPWCYYPKCASGIAYKDRLKQQRSVCSNISVGGIFLNPSEYSNIEISNTQVNSSSSNDSGINIYGGWCTKCTENEKCVSKGTEMVCVPKDSDDQEPSKDIFLSGSDRKVNWVIYPFIICCICLAMLVVIKIRYKNKYKFVTNTTLGVVMFLTFSFGILYFVDTNRESYTPDYSTQCENTTGNADNKICFSDNKCNDQQSCLNNTCQCKIGLSMSQQNKCVYDNTSMLSTLPYLPLSIFSGVYYYSTVIRGTIYVFATSGNFKYNGDAWVSLSTFENQSSFHPNQPKIPMDNPLCDTKYVLNTNMCCTDGDKVYIFLKNESLNKKIIGMLESNVIVYDTEVDKWSYFNVDVIEENHSSFLQGDEEGNASVTIVNNNILYIFNVNINPLSGKKLTKIGIVNLYTEESSVDTLDGSYMFDNNCHAFLHEGIIYIGGVYDMSKSTQNNSYDIYSFDEEKLKLTLSVSGLLPNLFQNGKTTVRGGPTGGVFPFYMDKKFYVVANNNFSYYDFDSNKYFDGVINIAYGTSVFDTITYGETYGKDIYMPFSSGNCTFVINGFVFIITGSGEIFIGKDTTVDGVANVSFTPCYGISNYEV